MLTTSGPLLTSNDRRNTVGQVRGIRIDTSRIGIEIIVGVTTKERYYRCWHFFITRSGFIAVEMLSSSSAIWFTCIASNELITKGFDDTSIFSGERSFGLIRSTYAIVDVGSLLRNEHGVWAVFETVGFYKHA